MNKIIAIALLLFFSSSFASNYTLDETALDQEFTELNAIEEKIQESNFDPSVVAAVKQTSSIALVSAEPLAINQANEFYVDWGSFAWGFCCCPIGFFVVAVSNNADDDMKMSYWIGVASGAVLGALTGGGYFITLGGCYF